MMWKTRLRSIVLAGVVLALNACADSPLQPDHPRAPELAPGAAVRDEQVQGCVLEGLCVIDPIAGGWCEPWMELDWNCDDDEGECATSVGDPTAPEWATTVQGCPGTDGGGGNPGGGTPPPGGSDPVTTPPDSTTCEDCNPPEEESTICPQPFLGNVQPALITVAGRNHEFQFHGSPTYPLRRLTGGASPATYRIGLPTTSKDSWWIAESGTITVFCRGAWITRRMWIGTLTVVDSDLHMVMAPGHPDF
jgi:hypothetical protein